MIYTSYFAKGSRLPEAVCIARSKPKWYHGPSFEALAPPWNLVHENDPARYRERYRREVLAKLDPRKVAEVLEGKVLLCWEADPAGCHRRLVAEWLQENLGIEVPELTSKGQLPGQNMSMDFE